MPNGYNLLVLGMCQDPNEPQPLTSSTFIYDYVIALLSLPLPKLRELLLWRQELRSKGDITPSTELSWLSLISRSEYDQSLLSTYAPLVYPPNYIKSLLNVTAVEGIDMDWGPLTIASTICDIIARKKAALEEMPTPLTPPANQQPSESPDRDIITGEYYLPVTQYLPIMTVCALVNLLMYGFFCILAISRTFE